MQENSIWGTCQVFFSHELQKTKKQKLNYTIHTLQWKQTSKGFYFPFLHKSQKMDRNLLCFCIINAWAWSSCWREWSLCSVWPCLRAAGFGPELAYAWTDLRAEGWIRSSLQPSLLSAGWLTVTKDETQWFSSSSLSSSLSQAVFLQHLR